MLLELLSSSIEAHWIPTFTGAYPGGSGPFGGDPEPSGYATAQLPTKCRGLSKEAINCSLNYKM